MNYPEYRKQGLPLTSSHIESTVKLINRCIKGSEKFWLREASECVLQLRTDYLSDSRPIKPFWSRWQADHTGSNHHQIAGSNHNPRNAHCRCDGDETSQIARQ